MAVERVEQWLRREFVAYNTELDEAYFAERAEVLLGVPALDRVKRALYTEGLELISAIDAYPDSPAERYSLLGAVGFYLGACRRHGIDDEPRAAWALADELGAGLGVAPRYVFAHQSTHNLAVDGVCRRFTTLPDEANFTTTNGLAVLAYQRAAAALRRVADVGVSSPLATYLLEDAKSALDDVLSFNRTLGKSLDVDRFYLNIRSYFMSHRVGSREYRGVNAGDFAAVNEIDLVLGLCSARYPFYQHVVTEKYPYVPPEDQPRLRAAMTARPLLGLFLRDPHPQNAELFLAVCRAHGAAYAHHHSRLVRHFLEGPARAARRQEDVTASGPPLDVVVEGLARLADLRAARDRPGLTTARSGLDALRRAIG
ncbi:monodechloroaminopyrrolnitrin synthase PrnB family protein [Actinokineospora fastidiosa]|uniref:Tryptophan 2,3-dioxygenase KynA n=1 Tax=Actinokineospora fastidiosa TaxID=1816 RepID=A0A918LGV9_9PSEU|nr:monodechloroaminopyrrolnitrin synthase PrnB family protein [Actinokineospora fastidiosa]GGS47232.1 tryptophan 2,3-dioxygenase KynA [Actinokineospora fastidiosa]